MKYYRSKATKRMVTLSMPFFRNLYFNWENYFIFQNYLFF